MRRTVVPEALCHRPFTLEEARLAGLDRWNLDSSTWRHLGHGVYAWAGLPETPRLVLAAIQLRLPPEAVFSGRTAAWLHGLDLPPLEPIEVTVPDESSLRPSKAVSARRACLRPDDVSAKQGLRLTSIERTLNDIAPRLPLVEAVIAFDTALRSRGTTLSDLHAWARRNVGVKGVVAYRRALALAHPRSESPMETRLRLTLVLAALPQPVIQAELVDLSGEVIGRADLYYPAQRLAIEYDGQGHRATLAADNRRQNRILAAGYRLLRFTADDVLGDPRGVVARVRAELRRPDKPRSRTRAA